MARQKRGLQISLPAPTTLALLLLGALVACGGRDHCTGGQVFDRRPEVMLGNLASRGRLTGTFNNGVFNGNLEKIKGVKAVISE